MTVFCGERFVKGAGGTLPLAQAVCRTLLVLAMCWGYVPAAQAQFAMIRGRVVDDADGQPLGGASILLENKGDGTQTGTAADGNGYFILSRIPPGTYVVTASFVGYLPESDTLAVSFDERMVLDLSLEPDPEELGEVVVESRREATGGGAGLETIRPSALARIPMPGVSADLGAYLQTLPSVVTAGDRGGQVFVRGGTPTQNLVLIDGMLLFQPFHIVGFYSAFPADIIAFANIYAGGFGARYGGRLSSVIDVSTRNGNKQRVIGSASLAPFLGAIRLEVPVLPQRISLLASVRESVIERVAPDLLGQDLPYRFGDRFVKLHAFLNRTSSASVTVLHTSDEGNVADTEGRANTIRWENLAVGARYVYLPEEFPALTQLRVSASRLTNRYQPSGAPLRDATTQMIGIEMGFIYFLGPTELHFGIFGNTYSFDFTLGGPRGGREEFVTEGGMYFDVPIEVGTSLILTPGLRLHSFPSRSQVTLEPRLQAEWRPGGETSWHVFSAAWGLYHQQIIGLYNARDVTDAFVTWSPAPELGDIPEAMHVLGGWKGQVAPWLSLGVEGYLKDMQHLAFAEYSELLEGGVRVDRVEGQAQGVDVKAEIIRPSFYGAVSYGLAKVTYERTVTRPVIVEEAGSFVQRMETFQDAFSPPHDRRHQVNALAQVTRGPYAVSVRWQYGSGLPFTSAVGFYDAIPVEAPRDDGFHTDPGSPVLLTNPTLYEERLPDYHRLDISVERRFNLGGAQATLQAAVINAYDRANIFDYDLFAGRRIDQLPLIPSLGLNVEFR